MTRAPGAPAPEPPQPLRTEVLDSHTHLDIQGCRVAEVVAAAKAVGVTRLIQVGTDLASSRWSATVAADHDPVWATVAIHPNTIPRLGENRRSEALAEIDRLAGLPQVRGVGETGLDYYRTGVEGHAAQQAAFRDQIRIAKRHDKALVIHDRDAHHDVLRILDEEGPPERVVFHCFAGDAAMAKTCAERGYVMSFAGNVTFKNATSLREALAAAPVDLVLVETDAPYLTPIPHRGKPNAPYLIPHTLRAMADVAGVAEDALAAAIWATGDRIFGPL